MAARAMRRRSRNRGASITYAGEQPDYDALRAMDYAPRAPGDLKGSGDGPKFLSFIRSRQVVPCGRRRGESSHSRNGLRRTFAARSYEGLHSDGRVIEGERHSGVKPEFNRGLRFLFGGE